MSTNEAERAVIAYLERTRSLTTQEASNFLHHGLANNWFGGKDEPELAELVRTYRDTMGRDGRKASTPR